MQISEENGFLKKLYYPIITISIIITIKLMIAKRKRNSIQLLFIIKSMNVVQLLSGMCLEKLEREHKYSQWESVRWVSLSTDCRTFLRWVANNSLRLLPGSAVNPLPMHSLKCVLVYLMLLMLLSLCLLITICTYWIIFQTLQYKILHLKLFLQAK